MLSAMDLFIINSDFYCFVFNLFFFIYQSGKDFLGSWENHRLTGRSLAGLKMLPIPSTDSGFHLNSSSVFFMFRTAATQQQQVWQLNLAALQFTRVKLINPHQAQSIHGSSMHCSIWWWNLHRPYPLSVATHTLGGFFFQLETIRTI